MINQKKKTKRFYLRWDHKIIKYVGEKNKKYSIQTSTATLLRQVSKYTNVYKLSRNLQKLLWKFKWR